MSLERGLGWQSLPGTEIKFSCKVKQGTAVQALDMEWIFYCFGRVISDFCRENFHPNMEHEMMTMTRGTQVIYCAC